MVLPLLLWLHAVGAGEMPNLSVGPMAGVSWTGGVLAPSFALDATWSPRNPVWPFWLAVAARWRSGDATPEPWAFDLEVGAWYMFNLGAGATAVLDPDGSIVPAIHAFADFPIPVVQWKASA